MLGNDRYDSCSKELPGMHKWPSKFEYFCIFKLIWNDSNIAEGIYWIRHKEKASGDFGEQKKKKI